ncbi:hypothetical protein EO244_00075 [Ancylomarina salipaludis]|uniref:Uncharacterized protein n=1 Tax=Ancylomarina salipaludis TaxID=2501299 RepID=A0A4Q1JQ53_9BACT|nr:hypothetical protein [Ancylomarina salipaludis]RXQ97328.1 hypothetical protein EO244_00075 [Ancylomarina salipaludis]
MKSLINNSYVGTLIGLLVPVLSIFIAYLVNFRDEMTFSQFIDGVLVLKIYAKLMAVAVYFGNVICFFLFIKLDWLKAARGVLLATIIYSFIVLLFRVGL